MVLTLLELIGYSLYSVIIFLHYPVHRQDHKIKKIVNINNLDISLKKTQIDYPCEWSYRIIGSDEHLLRKAAKSAVGNKKYTLSVSNRSSGGKYQSLNLELRVIDESERLRIFENLKNEAAINFVL